MPWVRSYLRQETLFSPGDRVLVAVSGGPDSVALLHILHRLRHELAIELGVGHFDHGLRGEQSRQDEIFVAALADQLQLSFHAGQGEVRQLAQREKISLQMAARRLRLQFLRETCQAHAYTKLAMGHTADDQVELFFIRVLRGTGPEGLKGMWPATADGLVRPLLAVGKAVLLAWLAQQSLPYREDLSNLNRRYLRNRLRLELLPDLQSRYNPRLPAAVWRLMAVLQEEEKLLAGEVAHCWQETGRMITPDLAALALPRLLTLPAAMQHRLLRLTLGKFLVDQEITSSQVAGLLELAQGKKSGGAIRFKGCQVARAGGELHLWRTLPPTPAGSQTILQHPNGQVDSPEGWRWRWRFRTLRPGEAPPPHPGCAWLDAARAAFPLQVRYARPGDRFWPLGGPGLKKLQDFLVDAKIPRWLRSHLPLIMSRGQIIWVVGLRIADPVKVTPASRDLLELEVSPIRPATVRIWEMLIALREFSAKVS